MQYTRVYFERAKKLWEDVESFDSHKLYKLETNSGVGAADAPFAPDEGQEETARRKAEAAHRYVPHGISVGNYAWIEDGTGRRRRVYLRMSMDEAWADEIEEGVESLRDLLQARACWDADMHDWRGRRNRQNPRRKEEMEEEKPERDEDSPDEGSMAMLSICR